MTEHNERSDIYSQLMAISQEAIERGYYETAYHALAAAMHCATSLGDDERLTRVETAAKAQQDWIDTHFPKHRMSRQSSVKRSGQSLYDVLARQAAVQKLIVKNGHRQEHIKHLPWLGDDLE